MTQPATLWANQTERGSPRLTRAALALIGRFGFPAGRVLALSSTAWFLLRAPAARRASADYLARALGRPARTADVARHFHHFAAAILDRVMLLSGQERRYDIQVEGLDHLTATLAQGTGAILLGAHLGSFEVLRTLARQAPVPVWALMYRRNAGALTGLLDQLAPDLRRHVLEIGDTASLLQARECVERGEIVGILADRGPPGHRAIRVPFLGGPAAFPSGPFVLAATLAAPVFLCHAVSTGRRRYRIEINPFCDRMLLRREHRDTDLRRYAAAYADALAALCRRYPFQWFNFFPFWEHDHAEPSATPPAAAPVAPAPAHPRGAG